MRPLKLAIFCCLWVAIICVPQTGGIVRSAWSNRYALRDNSKSVGAPPFGRVSPLAATLLQRFPNDKRVEIFAADSWKDGKTASTGIVWLARRHPRDASVLALQLRDSFRTLRHDRDVGPLSNPYFPLPPPRYGAGASPRSRWNEFMAVARRGQVLEPHNSFFDWMLLCGLYATRQDAEGRAVLGRAARKSHYDDHLREVALNRIEMLHLAYGDSVSPLDSEMAWSSVLYGELTKIRFCSRWIMEGVIRDRQNQQHQRALNTAFDLLRLSRVMRRSSYSLLGSITAQSCETTAINHVTPPQPVRWGVRPQWHLRPAAPLAALQNDPRLLYRYAAQHGRRDITSFLDAEWVELGQWQRAEWRDVTMTGESSKAWLTRMMLLPLGERILVLLLRSLPCALLLWGLIAMLSRRFKPEEKAQSLFGAACWGSLLLWLWVAQLDFALTTSTTGNLDSGFNNFFKFSGLLRDAPAVIAVGIAGMVLCSSWSQAIGWQRKQVEPPFLSRAWWGEFFGSLREEGSEVDFSPVFRIVARCSLLLVPVGATIAFLQWPAPLRGYFGAALPLASTLCVLGALGVSLWLHARSWRRFPRRRETLYRGFGLVAGAMAGLIVGTSLLFFGILGVVCTNSIGPQARFEAALHQGELASLRAHLGLLK